MWRFLIISALLLSAFPAAAESCGTNGSTSGDSIKRPGLVTRLLDYFAQANVPREDGKFDVSFLGGPHYSSDEGFGIGAVASGVYGMPVLDTINGKRRQSEVAAYIDVTTNGFVVTGIRGTQIFSHDDIRLNYNVFFSHNPRHYWGVGYEAARENDNYTKYTRLEVEAKSELLFRIKGNLYMGPSVDMKWVGARKVDDKSFWQGRHLAVASLGLGIILTYDSRDNTTAPTDGLHLVAAQEVFPSFLGNSRGAFSLTRISASVYTPAWRGCVIAFGFNGRFTSGNVPWTMMPTFGGSYCMRGYYEGQYNDKMETDVTLEFRQHIWRRSGLVAWVGAGSVFPDFKGFRVDRILPNGGIGYRWEFKKHSNVRLDIGFGKKQFGFIFNINEAF